MDYNHGTGHGVGAYLAVHEGPVGVGRDNSVLQVNALTGPSGFGQETQLLVSYPYDGINQLHFRSLSS